MIIDYTCPCGKKLQAEAEYIGECIRCPSCDAKIRIPARSGREARPVVHPATLSSPPVNPQRQGASDGSRRAVIAFVIALLSPMLLGIGGIVAVIHGVKALGEMRLAGDAAKRPRLAKAAVILGAGGIPVGLVVALFVLS